MAHSANDQQIELMAPSSAERKPTVTVMIPIYNGERFIEQTVRSVLDQTYQDLEVICVIDGTKDASRDILARIADPRLLVLEKENRGAVYRRNEGMRLARGRYLWFLDHDDVLMPTCIEAAVTKLEREGCAAVAVNGHLIDGSGRKLRRLYRVNKPDFHLRKLARRNQLFTTSQVLIRKDVLEQLGGFQEEAGSAVDWDLWIRLRQRGERILFLNRYLMGYRMHGDNDSNDYDKMLRSELHIVEHTLQHIGRQHVNQSYTYLQYASRAGDWQTLKQAVRLNAALLLSPRLYMTALLIASKKRKQSNNGGIAS